MPVNPGRIGHIEYSTVAIAMHITGADMLQFKCADVLGIRLLFNYNL